MGDSTIKAVPKSLKENLEHKTSLIDHFYKVVTDFLIKFAEFSKLELIMMGLEGIIKVSFHGEFMSQKFNEGFSCNIGGESKKDMQKRLAELKSQLISDAAQIVGKKRTERVLKVGSKIELKSSLVLANIKNSSAIESETNLENSINARLSKRVSGNTTLLELPPPEISRAKTNFRRFIHQIVLHLRHVKLCSVKAEYEKYDHDHHHNTIDDFFAAIPKSLSEFEGLMVKYVHKMLSKVKAIFRSLVETLIRRAGHMFNDEQNKLAELFSTLSQKMDCEVNIFGYLKAGVEVDIDLNASKLLDRFTILEGRDNGKKIHSEWASNIVLEHVKILHDIHVQEIRARNLGSTHFGCVKKQDRKKNHIFRRVKRWPIRYLLLSSGKTGGGSERITSKSMKEQSPSLQRTKSITNSIGSIKYDQEYFYKLEYFRHPTDKQAHSTSVILTDKMWCFSDSTYENAFKVKVDHNGIGFKEGCDGLSPNWETIFSAICVKSSDDEYLEAVGTVNEDLDATRDKWVAKINEAINLIQGKIDEEENENFL